MSGTGLPPGPEIAEDEQVKPLNPPMVPFTVGGMIVFAIAAMVALPLRDTHASWFWIALAGLLWGIPGLLTMIRHDRRR